MTKTGRLELSSLRSQLAGGIAVRDCHWSVVIREKSSQAPFFAVVFQKHAVVFQMLAVVFQERAVVFQMLAVVFQKYAVVFQMLAVVFQKHAVVFQMLAVVFQIHAVVFGRSLQRKREKVDRPENPFFSSSLRAFYRIVNAFVTSW